MRDLSAQTGIGADGNYLNGNLVDNQTLVGEGINQDLVQFFQKLADLASIVFNGLPDNETNGYQLIEALETVVRSFAASTSLPGVAERALQAEVDAFESTRFVTGQTLEGFKASQVQVNASNASRFVTGATLKGYLDNFLLNGLQMDRADFSGWNMNTTVGINVPYSLPSGKRIAFIDATIFRDTDPSTKYRKLTSYSSNLNDGRMNGGVGEFGGAVGNNIVLYRTTGGDFDSVNFDTVNGSCYIFLEDIP